jgi:hypothetical protein
VDGGEGRQVLAGCVQDPLSVRNGRTDGGQIRQLDRIYHDRSAPDAAQLDEVRPLAVAVAGRPLGIHRDGAASVRQALDREP